MELPAPEVVIESKPANECWSCSFRRRALLVFFVALTLWLTQGCAAYEMRAVPASSGTVQVSWIFEQTFPDNRCGEAIRIGPGVYILRFAGKPPSFNDTAKLACIGHEAIHFMGASHQ